MPKPGMNPTNEKRYPDRGANPTQNESLLAYLQRHSRQQIRKCMGVVRIL